MSDQSDDNEVNVGRHPNLDRPWLESRELKPRDYRAINLPERYWETEVERIPNGPADDPDGERHDKYRARDKVKRYLDNLYEMRTRGVGLLFLGPNGRGKTAALAHVLKAFRSHGQSALYVRSEPLRSARIDKVNFSRDYDLWEFAEIADVLLLDDVGKEYTSEESDWSETVFESFLRGRYSKRRVTLMASNMTLDDLKDRYKTSTLSVLKSMVSVQEVRGPNQRDQEAKDDLAEFQDI